MNYDNKKNCTAKAGCGFELMLACALFFCTLAIPSSLFAQINMTITDGVAAPHALSFEALAKPTKAVPSVSTSDADDEQAALTLVQQKLKRKISLDLRDMDIVDVYKFLALKGDFNIVIGKEIKGRVTLFIKEVSIVDALQIISIANNLGYHIMNGIIYVMTEQEYMATFGKKFNDKRKVKITYLKFIKPSYALEALRNIKSDIGTVVVDEETGSIVMVDTAEKIEQMEKNLTSLDRPFELKVFSLQYSVADDVATKLKEKIDVKAVGSVQADQRSNQIIVHAYPERLKEIEGLIKAIDKPTKAVLIETKIMQITLNPKMDSGIEWDRIFQMLHIEKVGNLGVQSAFPVSSSISTATNLGSVGVFNFERSTPDALSATLKVLKQVLSTKILANPKILVTNNKEARIHIGDKLAYVTTTTTGTGADKSTNEEINFIDVGVQLKVTPIINDNGMVTLAIRPEISSQTGSLTTPAGSNVPLINTTLVETNIIVQDGNTVIIGGLRREDKSTTRKGVPGLMDVPILRGLFSSNSEEYKQTEIVILLTPHIVSGKENYVEQEGQTRTIKPRKSYE